MQDAGSSEPTPTQTVDIPGRWVFEPRVAEVQAGIPVRFTNHGGAAHTVTFATLDFDVTIGAGGEASHTFDAPGTYEYVCKLHPPDMKGTLVVRSA